MDYKINPRIYELFQKLSPQDRENFLKDMLKIEEESKRKKKYKVIATEEIWYEKIVEAENEDQAYEIFAETADNEDIVEGHGFEVTEIMLLKEERDD